ncbi:MAG: Nudix family hydrolase [Salinisphaera sp.]|jgi:8-oxo-dGTP diphosphatase|nr:Nudix family hydrolase [Salinisphaera sp.]
MGDVLDIAVGVLVAADGQLLIARRRADTVGAGFWEFPGGKFESGEGPFECLARELEEEIGVTDIEGAPLVRFTHDRGPRPVRLHVWQVNRWQGEASGREGQAIRWMPVDALDVKALLPATEVILNALRLPAHYLITPAVASLGEVGWLTAIDRALANGIRLLRVRDHDLSDTRYAELARRVVERALISQARVLVDRSASLMHEIGAHGLHWPASRLADNSARPVDDGFSLAVSAHDADDLTLAVAHRADFATLSPVSATASHPGQTPLGWRGFERIRRDVALPVYALGGLAGADLADARAHNAQGVAAIRGFWPPVSG